MIGTRLGVYHVQALLGAGGMGEVYRARDTRLERDVAIKVLPAAWTSDPERLGRLEREARVLASLTHPHIGAIYGLEETGGLRALVLELVDGPTLAQRITQGPLPVSEALPIAAQIAEALSAAHEKGIIHRDLKPANIKLSSRGVKLLDFGLAKSAPSHDAETAVATQAGVLLGTVAYMSPEQARGLEVDKRTDTWAFGCVLYEMLTGTRVFRGDSSLDLLAAIASEAPDFALLPASTPPAVRRLLERCLTKDRQQRLRDIGDAAVDLGAMARGDPTPARSTAPGLRRYAWPAALTLVALAAAMVWMAVGRRQTGESSDRMVFTIGPPEGVVWGMLPPQPMPRVAPDGHRIVFQGRSVTGTVGLWLQDLGSVEARYLPDTQQAGAGAFWSPDSSRLAYCVGGTMIRKIDLGGRPPEEIAAPCTVEGSWSSRGEFLFTGADGLFVVPENGGASTRATTVDLSRETAHLYPRWLPDGRHFLYMVRSLNPDIRGICLGLVGGGQPVRLLADDSMAEYAEGTAGTGYVLFVRGATLLAQPVSASSFAVSGPPIVMADRMGVGLGRRPSFAASSSLLVYRSGGAYSDAALVWFDRNGRRIGQPIGGAIPITSADLSHDGSTVAYARFDRNTNNLSLWTVNVARGTEQSLFAPPYFADNPTFSPDGHQLAFSSADTGVMRPRVLTLGANPAPSVVHPTATFNVSDWSSDGRVIIGTSNTGAVVWVSPGQTSPPTVAVPRGAHATFSPDARWLAYTSLEPGTPEVYVQRFPDGTEKTRISLKGGFQPRWRGDGHELFYLTDDGDVMAVGIRLGARVDVDAPVRVFRDRFEPGGSTYTRRDLLVTRDGQRFLVRLQSSDPKPLTAVRNWIR